MTLTTEPTLHMLCGRIASGKSTLAQNLSQEPGIVRVSEDALLARLYGGEMKTLSDYVQCSGRLAAAMEPLLQDILRAGASVVLDFPANTVAARAWMRGMAEAAGAECRVHFLDVPEEICRARLRARNAAGTHEFSATDAQFDLISAHFQAPTPAEGLIILYY